MKMMLRGTWKKTSNQNLTSTGEIELIPEKPNIGKNSFVREINSHWILIKEDLRIGFNLPWKSQCRCGGIGRRDGFKIRFLRKCWFESSHRYHQGFLAFASSTFLNIHNYGISHNWIKSDRSLTSLIIMGSSVSSFTSMTGSKDWNSPPVDFRISNLPDVRFSILITRSLVEIS